MIEYGIGSVRLDSRYDFGAVGASKFEDDKYGFCDTDEELQEVEKDGKGEGVRMHDDASEGGCGLGYGSAW